MKGYDEEDDIINEININDNKLIKMNNIYNICKSTVFIKYNKKTGSGFFIKFSKINKPFYCLMTNEHVINSQMILNKEEINIRFDNKKRELTIKLNEKERIIKTFKYLKIDATIIEILEKDNITDDYFLLPSLDYINENGYNYFVSKEIEIPQFPGGKELSFSKGIIKEVYLDNDQYQFSHLASTESGSSGSPIVLKGQECVLGIHKGGSEIEEKNYGDFIGPINDIIHTLKKNGEGIEYYKNGKIKYEGNFVDDLYDGNDGHYFYENGEIYIGQFKKGKRNGNGCIYNSEYELITEGTFLDDRLVTEEKTDNINDIESNDNDDSNNSRNDSDNYSEDNKKNSNNKNDSLNDINDKGDYPNDNEDKDINNKVKNNNNNEGNNHNNNIDINNRNYDNNNSNSNNNAFNINNIIDIDTMATNIKTSAFHMLHGLGNFLGVKCLGCGHLVEKHEKIEFGKWKCSECDENNNICSTLREK